MIQRLNISQSLFHLYLNRTIQLVGFGLFGVFLPIFLYEQFDSNIFAVIVFFALSYVLSIILFPLGGKAMTFLGMKRSMILGTLFITFFYISLFLYQESPQLIYLAVALLGVNFFRALYWVPYHSGFVNLSNRRVRGQQSSILKVIADIIGVILPIVTGLILTYYNYDFLFVISVTIVLLSIIPIRNIEARDEKYSYGYFETYKRLFNLENRDMLVAYTAHGAEQIVGYLVWPIFIFGILQGEYLAVGAVSALIIGVTVLLDLIMGKWSDKKNKKSFIKMGSIFYALGWIVKIFVQTGFQIFIVSTYHNITAIFRNVPFDALMYEQAADAGQYVDEYTMLREISLGIGRVLMLGVIALFIYYFGIGIAFAVTAVISLFINALE